MSILRRRDTSGTGPGGCAGPGASEIALAYPSVWEMISEGHYPDGGPRLGATLLVFVDEGVVKLCLNDRDQEVSAWVSGASWDAAMAVLEDGLVRDTLTWRRPPARGKRQR